MINKQENISFGIYCDDISIPGGELTQIRNTSATVGTKNCKKYKVH
jgi:hypothetical protein